MQVKNSIVRQSPPPHLLQFLPKLNLSPKWSRRWPPLPHVMMKRIRGTSSNSTRSPVSSCFNPKRCSDAKPLVSGPRLLEVIVTGFGAFPFDDLFKDSKMLQSHLSNNNGYRIELLPGTYDAWLPQIVTPRIFLARFYNVVPSCSTSWCTSTILDIYFFYYIYIQLRYMAIEWCIYIYYR